MAVACNDDSSSPTSLAPPTSVAAASVHLKGGKNATPSFNDLGLRLNEQGDASGLGNYDIYVSLTAHANATATCTNPSGQQEPAGQNPAPVEVTGGVAIPASEIDNGNLHFDVTTLIPASAGPRGAAKRECNQSSTGQWTYAVTDLQFTDATLTIQQPQDGGNPAANIVLTLVCTFTPATANGPVASGKFSC